MTGHAPAIVIIPTLNEIAHIETLLTRVIAEPGTIVAEIIVADGGSVDGTQNAVLKIADHDARVRLIDNPDRIQAAGINRAVAAATSAATSIVRIDAHAVYPDRYVGRLLESMAASDADSVVVRLTTVGRSRFQRAVAAAQNSRIGTGGSAHRMGGASRFVEHGHHAAMSRALFTAANGYDASFEANEDAELDARLRALGGRIWLDTDIPVLYFPRSNLRGLWRQYWRYGSGRARNYLKHRERLRIRQMLPPIVVAACLLGLIAAPLIPAALILPIGYLGTVTAAAAMLALTNRSAALLLAAPAFVTMHFAWGLGFMQRIIVGAKSVHSGVHVPDAQQL